MTLDLPSLQVSASAVLLVAASIYVLETLLRRDGVAGRLWAAAFLAGVLSALCYLVWMLQPSAFVGVAVGNGAFVAATAGIWLGCVAFNGRGLRRPSALAGAAVVVVVVAALVEGSGKGAWAGAVPLFLGNALFALLGAIETRRGAIGRRWSAAGLTVVLAIEAAWFTVRTVVFVVAGPDSPLFREAFGSEVSSLLTMVLVVAAVVVTSVLRASESALRGQPETRQLTVDLQGVLMPDSFRLVLEVLMARATAAGEEMCVVAVRIDDLDQVSAAFDPDEAETIARALRAAVRRFAPTMALVGATDSAALSLAYALRPGTDVSRAARTLHEHVVSEIAVNGTSVVPVVGIGVARSGEHGRDAETLIARAQAAAAVAAAGGEQPFGAAGRLG